MRAPPAPRMTSLLRLGVVSGWLLFTLMVIAISWAGSVLRGRPPGLGGLLLWNAGWLLWIAGTFVVVRLARRFPIERGQVGRGIALHALLGVGVAAGMLALEFLLNHALERLWPAGPRANALLGFFVYKFHVYFLIYWMIVGLTRAFDFHARFRETELRASQLDARLAQAQLDSLKAQLQPHFLFNTHHAIISLMLKQDTNAAIRMLTRLSDLLRLTLRKTDQQLSSVQDELAALDLYLGIQRERYGDRLIVEVEAAPAALAAEIPWLLLQPLVENALKHGVDARAAGGRVQVQIRREGTRLGVSVRDNGNGFPQEFALETSDGIGLRNTRARLVRLYGHAQTFACRNAPGGGAIVEVTLPWRAFTPGEAAPSLQPAHE